MSTAEPLPRPRETVAGLLLLAAALVGTVVMGFHPTGHELRGPDAGAARVRNAVVHGLAITAILLQTCGALAIVRRVRAPAVGLAECAFVAQCAAAVGVTIAAICSGFVMPALLAEHAALDGSHPGQEVVWRFNQAFARLFVVAGGAAILGWSVAGWRRGLHRATAVLGAVVGAGAALAVGAGHLRLDVHGMGAVVLAHQVWWACVGFWLLRGRSTG